MEVVKGTVRNAVGTHRTRSLRREGMIPGIIYGHGRENVSFAISAHDLGRVLQHGERVLEMDLEGSREHYLIKEVQRDAFDQTVIHVDFARVRLDETVEVEVPIVLRGKAAGEVEGGVVTPGVAQVRVKCLVLNLPEEIVVRINDMKVGDTLRVKNLPALEGGTILTDGEALIASCQLIAEEVAAPAVEGEEEAAVEPEIIAKGKEEDEETAEEA